MNLSDWFLAAVGVYTLFEIANALRGIADALETIAEQRDSE